MAPRASNSHNASSLAFLGRPPFFSFFPYLFFCSLMIPSCACRPIGILSSSLEEPHYEALVPHSGCFIAAGSRRDWRERWKRLWTFWVGAEAEMEVEAGLLLFLSLSLFLTHTYSALVAYNK